MQSSCIGSLMSLAQADSRILYLTSDSGEGGLDLMFRRNFPKQCLDFGISEASLISSASGLALGGLKPFVYTAAPFLLYRAYEFVRNDVCLQNVNVKMIGSGSGLSVGELGATHHTTEDTALLRSLPNLTVLSPATPKQAFLAVLKAYQTEGPVYIRLEMNKEKEYFEGFYELNENGFDIVLSGSDIIMITMGSILEEVMDSCVFLKEQGIDPSVVCVHTVKPFSEEKLADELKRYHACLVVEEHNVIGGLGSMVLEAAFVHDIKIKVEKLGLSDCFSAGYGTKRQVRAENGLDAYSIFQKAVELLR